jgi:hypothetical protein
MDRSGRTLDSEGVPDLEGPIPEKAMTGDPQERLAPPNEPVDEIEAAEGRS